ncbi:methyl-accepting chemotaxis protein [Sphingomonas sp. 37zxx]|uniref:methyl-accepting chemotaxis protein n=1 Tax=Sphingomonas sp. 37zxx TaxID=1550073 RepID=UPI00068AA189|nr:methyl-accepting chemotaxis protein [Sphingomonas sp. 37zxx]
MLFKSTIRAKLILCLSMFAFALLALLITLAAVVRTDSAAFQTLLTDRVIPLGDLKFVTDQYAVAIVDASHKARDGNLSIAEAADQVREGRAEIDARWKVYRASFMTEHEEKLAKTAEQRMESADQVVAALQTALDADDRAALDRIVATDLYPAIDPASAALSALVEEQIKVAKEVSDGALDFDRAAVIVSAVIALIAGAVWVFALVVARNAIITPIATLADTMEKLADKTSDALIPYQEQPNEIGRMSRACEIFRSAAVERALAESAATQTQQQVTAALRDAISAISAGDLGRDINSPFPIDYEPVRQDFNAALMRLRGLIGAVAESARGITTGSSEIAVATEDLARRTEGNAASLEETSASITLMGKRLQGVADSAARTLQSADEAARSVENGREVAASASDAMARVSDSARGIDDVIEGLDKIAFQTRVLAMNAAVEAGRAGEAGRGFAVVADLVSALAMRAEEEAKRARDQLTVTQSEVGSAVEMVARVDAALVRIADATGQVHTLLDSMSHENRAQAEAITDIATAVAAMDRATQQNAAMVEETSAAARNLQSEVLTLNEQAGQFRVSQSARSRHGTGMAEVQHLSAQPS